MIPRMLQRLGVTRGVSILMYHGVAAKPLPFHNWCFVTADAFRRQMAYLKRHVDVIPLTEVPAHANKVAAASRRSKAEAGRLSHSVSRPTVAITFDDGYRNNYDAALPILREFSLPATVFLTTGLINTDDTVWDGRLYLALCQTAQSQFEWEGVTYRWQQPSELAEVFHSSKEVLKKYPQHELRQKVREIVALLGQDPDQPVPKDSPVHMLNTDEIAAMVDSGLIDFGAHTHHHSILSRLDSATKRNEIEHSITEASRLTGKPCALFAYPNGSPADYDPECVHILEEAGIQLAVTTIEEPNHSDTPALELRRYGIGGGLPLARFQLKVHHLEHALKRWKK